MAIAKPVKKAVKKTAKKTTKKSAATTALTEAIYQDTSSEIWQYKMVPFDGVDALNVLAEDGWELVWVTNSGHLVLKKRRAA